MKKLAFAVVILIALGACKSKPAREANKAPKDPTAALIKQLKPILSGVWVKADYLEKIQATHSVLAAVVNVGGVTGIRIDTAAINGDSLQADVGWDNHNPGTVMLKFKPGKRPQTIKFGDFELGYQIAGHDTSLILYQVYDKVLYTSYYHKQLPFNAEQNLSYGMRYTINKAVLAGTYRYDIKGKPVQVTFNPEGDVTGMPGFKTYLIEGDLKYGPMNNADQITFDPYTSHQQTLKYVVQGDMLQLYDLKPNPKQTLLVSGKLKYSLQRNPD